MQIKRKCALMMRSSIIVVRYVKWFIVNESDDLPSEEETWIYLRVRTCPIDWCDQMIQKCFCIERDQRQEDASRSPVQVDSRRLMIGDNYLWPTQTEVVSALASQPTPHAGSDPDGQDNILGEQSHEKVKVECRHTKLFIDAHRKAHILREYRENTYAARIIFRVLHIATMHY